MLLLFSNNSAKQEPISKQKLWLFYTFSAKKYTQVVWFYSNSIFERLYFYFVLECVAIYF